MFLRHTTANENVSCEQRRRQLTSWAGDGIPSLTRANRAEARWVRTYQPRNAFQGGGLNAA